VYRQRLASDLGNLAYGDHAASQMRARICAEHGCEVQGRRFIALEQAAVTRQRE
jgi:hypothetical protein